MKRTIPFLLLVASAALLSSCRQSFQITQRTNQVYTIDKARPQDSAVMQVLRPYKAGVDTQMQVVIGYTDIPLTKAQPESTLGNFMADAQMVRARQLDNKVVASVANYGGIRLPYIAPGPLTKGKIYELMPFDNMLTIVEVPGSVLKQLCHHMARYRGWPVAGISFTIKNKEAVDVTVNGNPVNEHIVYKVAMSDYIARGGDNCDFLLPLRKKYTSVLVRDAMIDYVTRLQSEGKPLHPNLEKRIKYAE